MRTVVQRVSSAKVEVDGKITGQISKGYLVLVAVHKDDTQKDVAWMANKIAGLRIFSDAEDKMNLSVKDVGGEILAVSQFTLYGDCRNGRRPSYSQSADPQSAAVFYSSFVNALRDLGLTVQEGVFQAHMEVSLVNDGPVTVVIDSPGSSRDSSSEK